MSEESLPNPNHRGTYVSRRIAEMDSGDYPKRNGHAHSNTKPLHKIMGELAEVKEAFEVGKNKFVIDMEKAVDAAISNGVAKAFRYHKEKKRAAHEELKTSFSRTQNNTKPAPTVSRKWNNSFIPKTTSPDTPGLHPITIDDPVAVEVH